MLSLIDVPWHVWSWVGCGCTCPRVLPPSNRPAPCFRCLSAQTYLKSPVTCPLVYIADSFLYPIGFRWCVFWCIPNSKVICMKSELAKHAHSHGSHVFTHTLTSTQLPTHGAKHQLSYYYSVHAACFYRIHQTLTWNTGSLSCQHDHSYACVYTQGLGTPTASQHNIFDSKKLTLSRK